MKVDAYKLAEGIDPAARSRELEKLWLIDRFSVRAVLGRDVLYHREMMLMLTAENIYKAKLANMHSDNWAEWAKDNPSLAKQLAEVEKLVNG